jgi:ABC-type transport system involved in multi-copper enzyme maturation permease subunit
MRIWALAWSTFGTFWRDRLIIVFLVIFACAVLFLMSPLMVAKAMTTASNAQQLQAMVLGIVSIVAGMVSGVGSLLAAWVTAGAISSELKSGTILAVMARPIRRWEFLLAKFLSVQILMAVMCS